MIKIGIYFLPLIVISNQWNYSETYKPVVLIHGILTGAPSMLVIQSEIMENHPGTIVYNIDQFSGWSSIENAWRQVKTMSQELQTICERHPNGIHLLGYSQGGLLARAILETYTNHTVKNFISLSSPQAGQFGTAFLHLIFPGLLAKNAYELFYSYVGQHTSVGNYWNDPHQQDLYYNFSSFLPYINNEIQSENSTKFKQGLLKLNRMILIGGPNDGVISPWQSSHFGYYDDNDNVVPMHSRDIYRNDKIGLKTLDRAGKLEIVSFSHVKHLEWHLNTTVIREAILPYLI